MDLHEKMLSELKRDIKRHCKKTGETRQAFGINAAKDAGFLSRLDKGNSTITLKKYCAVRQYIGAVNA